MGDFPLLVPPMIKLTFVFVAPFFWSVMGSMHSRGAEIDEPGFVRIGCPDVLCPGNRFVGHVFGEMITLFRRFWLGNRSRISVDHRIILMGLSLIESIEVIKAQARWPAVKWPGRTDRGFWSIVPFPEHARGISIVT